MAGVRGLAADALLAVGVAAVALVDALDVDAGPLEVGLLLAAALVLVARRRAPRVVLVVCLGLLLTYGTRVGLGLFTAVPALVALYTVVVAGHRLFVLAVAAPLVAGSVGTAIREGGALQEALLPAGWLVAALLLGEVARERAAQLRAARLRAEEAERTREEAAARRAAEERLRIARDLHDSLTHSISVITLRARVAVHLARKRGEEVPEVLLAIEEAGGAAARELRTALSALRVDEDGLDRLPGLLDRARGAGLEVTVTTGGRPRRLPAEVDRAAYRVVQEALTNVLRHADTTSAAITIDYGSSDLTVRVEDEGSPVPREDAEPGLGLVGMRERVTALGGRLLAHPGDTGGFTVSAEIPVPKDMR
ncbi:sensor histidine kinase [Actinophytocola xanthii]|uniref:histidine kinase n=1 Tax=Actinophytocola xanthii TaxID=1912961 RepID=A0A1Q8C2L9_9PSEU|nr:histidine kinase [Actinophytocola xanthii]OLF08615.1 hypothetical protein BU204_33925 [Actinophytocola xanthii]